MQNYVQDFHHEFQAPDAPPAFQMAPFYQGGFQQNIEPVFQENFLANMDPAFQQDWNNFNQAQLNEGWNDAYLAPNNVNLPPISDRRLFEVAIEKLNAAENRIRELDQEIQLRDQIIDDTYNHNADFVERHRVEQQEQEQAMREKDREIEQLKAQLKAGKVAYVEDVTSCLQFTERLSERVQYLDAERIDADAKRIDADAKRIEADAKRIEAAAEAARKQGESLEMQRKALAMVEKALNNQKRSEGSSLSAWTKLVDQEKTISELEQTIASLSKKVAAQQITNQRQFRDSMILRRSKRVNESEGAAKDEPRTNGGAIRPTTRRARK